MDISELRWISGVILNAFFKERVLGKLRYEKRRICPDRMGRLRDRARIKALEDIDL